jgi:transcriptional regulator with XRE-family HTH domain
MSPEQCRAARGWLDWTQQVLAERAHVGLSTVKDFEKGQRTPVPNNLTAIRTAIEDAGVKLVFGKDGAAAGIAGEPRPTQKRPPADGARRRPGRRPAKRKG